MRLNHMMLEITPPSKRASDEFVSKSTEKVAGVVGSAGCIDIINVPEILEENREGMPLYRNLETREYGLAIREKTGVKIAVNKVVVFFESENRFQKWLAETVEKYAITDLIFVGGYSSKMKYPGPNVMKANAIAAKWKNVRVGNICIPQRKGEAERLLAKTLSGCNYFTTQIIMESKTIKTLLGKYDAECRSRKVTPSEIYISFAPARDGHDIEFFEWLGAEMPSEAEKMLKLSGDMGKASIELSRGILADVFSFCEQEKIAVPISINVEPMSQSNLPLAQEMIQELSDSIR
ncbi:MAG: mycobacterial-type methylenetetrahydrofolate reductase [Candidatus Micrarchaeota archaeon]